jgi:hypothetical protein
MGSQGYRRAPWLLSRSDAGLLVIGHHRGMSSTAEISSLSSTLSELHDRVTALAESSLASGDEDVSHELIAVERALGGALRRLRRLAAGQGPGAGR